MPMKKTNVELDANEVALIVGEEDGSMTVRVVPATELEEGAQDVPEPYEIAVALAVRLLNDPDFHDDVLEWYESQEDEDGEDEDEDEEGDELGDEDADEDGDGKGDDKPASGRPVKEAPDHSPDHAPGNKPAKDA